MNETGKNTVLVKQGMKTKMTLEIVNYLDGNEVVFGTSDRFLCGKGLVK